MNILAVTAMRNEGPHCLEWFAHHLAAGISHFLVFSNDCDDGTDAMLDLLANTGILTHIRLKQGDRPVQWQAMKQARSADVYANADWVLVSDCDEFINLRAPIDTIADLIGTLPSDTDALAMPWRLFGNAGHAGMQDRLTTGRFTRCAPADISLPLAWFFKTLYRPGAFRQLGVHRPKRKKDHLPVWVDAGGNYLPQSFCEMDSRINLFGQPVSNELVQLNHYSLRSAENFMVKRRRGLPNHVDREIGLGYWVERNFNGVEDTTIQRMLPATETRLAELLRLPGMTSLHEQAFVNHQSQFNTAMQDRAEIQLFWHLNLSADSRPPDPVLTRQQINRIGQARSGGKT